MKLVGIIALVFALGSYAAEEPPVSFTTTDGKTLTNVKLLGQEKGDVFLHYAGPDGIGMAWFDMDTIPDSARQSLGLPLSSEQASFESALLHVAQNASFQAEANLGDEARQKQWQAEALASLAGPVHKVSFIAEDGETVTEDSSDLTQEQTALYTGQYVGQQQAAWSNSPNSPYYMMLLNERWLEHVFRRATREERRQEEIARRLNGPDQEVSVIEADGKRVTKTSSHLTAEERKLYVKQYITQQRAIERQHRPAPASVTQVETLHQEPNATGQLGAQRQRQNTVRQQPAPPPRQEAPATSRPNSDALKRQARAGNKSAQAQLKSMGLSW